MHAGKCAGGGCRVVTGAEAVEIGGVVEVVD